jgi:hypothetical protein
LPEFGNVLASTSALFVGSASPRRRPTPSASATIASRKQTTPTTTFANVSPPIVVVARLWKISAGTST